jgi:hypothetical protein
LGIEKGGSEEPPWMSKTLGKQPAAIDLHALAVGIKR